MRNASSRARPTSRRSRPRKRSCASNSERLVPASSRDRLSVVALPSVFRSVRHASFMTQVSTTEIPGSSTRPYLIRALHDWCTDNGFTPYLAVHVDRAVQVPMEYVKNNEIVLNVGFEATSGLKLGNDFIEV